MTYVATFSDIDREIEQIAYSVAGHDLFDIFGNSTNAIITSQTMTTPLLLLKTLKKQGPYDASGIEKMIHATYLYSKGLASLFHVQLDYFSDISNLVEALKAHHLITKEEWNRLTVLQMVLDGLDMEISEDGGEMSAEDVDYASEFCEIIERAYSRLGSLHRPRIWSSSEQILSTESASNPILIASFRSSDSVMIIRLAKLARRTLTG